MRVFLLAPKVSRHGGELPDYRADLMRRLEQHGHAAVVMENDPGQGRETLREKFLRLAGACGQAVLVWPAGAAMATTADEVVLLQEACERGAIGVILVLDEGEVELRDHELHVLAARDQSRYLDGILACRPSVLEWRKSESFESVVDRYADAFL